MISGKQIKLARTSLDWTQEYLAEKTGLSATTIYNLERGDISPRPASESALRQIFETAGIEFIEQDGIRHYSQDVTVYKGPGSAERFFSHVLAAIKPGDDEIVGIFQTPRIFLQSCLLSRANADLYNKITAAAAVKCLLPATLPITNTMPPFKYRLTDETELGTESCFTYANKHALIVPDGSSAFCFIVINSYTLALNKRRHFMKLWEKIGPSPRLQHEQPVALAAFA